MTEPGTELHTFSLRASAPAKWWASAFGVIGALISGAYAYRSNAETDARIRVLEAAREQTEKDGVSARRQLQDRVCLLEEQLTLVTAVLVRDKAADAERDKTRKQAAASFAERYFNADTAHWRKCTDDTRIDLAERQRRTVQMAITSALEAPAPR